MTKILHKEELKTGEPEKGEPKKEFTFRTPLQSELTNLIAKEILFHNQCILTSYNESAKQHRVLLEAFTEHSENILGRKIEYCRIT